MKLFSEERGNENPTDRPKTEKPTEKIAKTVKPKIPMPPSCVQVNAVFFYNFSN